MVLPQILAGSEIGVALYEDGIFQGYENVVTLTDEQLAEEAEQKAMEKAEDLIDSISNLAGAKIFLKRLVRRLIVKGYLP